MTNPLRFLHLADVHIGASFGYLPPELAQQRRQDIRKAFRDAITLACGETNDHDKVQLLLIAGDLFDTATPSIADIVFVQEQLLRAKKAGISIYCTPGNHDWFEAGNFWETDALPLTHLFSSYGFELVHDHKLNIRIASVGYNRHMASRHVLDGMTIPSDTTPLIFLFHGSWDHQGLEQLRDYPFTSTELERIPFVYAGLGHYHKFTCVIDRPDRKAFYPGSIEGLQFTKPELGKRCVILGEIDADGLVKVLPVEINNKELTQLEIDCTFTTYRGIMKQLTLLSAPHRMLQVTLTGSPSLSLLAEVSSLEQEIRDSFCFLQVKLSFTPVIRDIPQEDTTYVGLFVKKMQEKIKNATSKDERLLLQKALEFGLIAASKKV